MRYLPSLIILGAVGIVSAACGSGSERSGFDPGTAGAPGAEGPGLGSTVDASAPKAGETCAALVKSAERAKVDIIVVIDTSPSMGEETDQVKQNINAFAQAIGNSGIDYNVVMIAEKPLAFIPPGLPLPGICVPPPLAGPNCGDAPRFHHLNTEVDSRNSLQLLLDKFSEYSGWLREPAVKVFVEVTDDNSDLAWEAFDQQLLTKSPAHFGTDGARRYIFNSICGYARNTAVLSANTCDTAENTGDQYQHLSQLTGGVVDSVCETSYASVFDNIAKGLITRIGCEFAIPKGEDGKQTDPNTVIVNYTPGDGSGVKTLTQVTDPGKCATNPDSWHYDNASAPTKIVFCPSTCSTAGVDPAGKLEILVGCGAPPPK